MSAQAAVAVDIPGWVAWAAVLSVILCSVIASLIVFSTREYTPQEERT